jgi:hypothetical protein
VATERHPRQNIAKQSIPCYYYCLCSTSIWAVRSQSLILYRPVSSCATPSSLLLTFCVPFVVTSGVLSSVARHLIIHWLDQHQGPCFSLLSLFRTFSRFTRPTPLQDSRSARLFSSHLFHNTSPRSLTFRCVCLPGLRT